jgi:hypothetical protein
MILTTQRGPGCQEGAAAEKAVPFPTPLFEAKPLVAASSTPWAWRKNASENVRGRSAAQTEEESSITNRGSK